MPGGHSNSAVGFGLGLSLMAAAVPAVSAVPAAGTKLPNAQVEPLKFAELNGWQDDDHAVAFGAFLKSCGAILQGDKAMRKARPVFGGLFNACTNAVALGTPDRAQA